LNRDENAVRHEEGLALFILPERRRRFRHLLGEGRLPALYHFNWLDPRFAEPLPSKQGSPKFLGALLRERGAPEQCYVVSTIVEIDRGEMLLDEALAWVNTLDNGTFISCLPGKLAYFESEDGRYILQHP
jgi:hypothetical protein